MANPRIKPVLAGKGQKAGLKADELTVPLGHRRHQLIVPELAGHASQGAESVDMTALPRGRAVGTTTGDCRYLRTVGRLIFR